MVKNNDLKAIYDYLSEKYDNWVCTSSKSQKEEIERLVYFYLENIDDALYSEMSNERVRGLCDSQFFEDDILQCINILKEKLEIQH